jgi:hypothetical protein
MGAYRELVPSAARTTNGSAEIDLDDNVDSIRLVLDITAVSGAGATLALVIEESFDGANWNATALDTFPNQTATGRVYRTIANTLLYGQRFRARWTITGTTPSFTFSLHGAEKLQR